MQTIVRGHNVEVTEALKTHAQEKADKIEKFFDNIQEALVELNYSHTSAKDKRNIAQITIFVSGSILRAEEASEDMYASIDLAVDKMERQLIKYKDKLHDKHRKQAEVGKSLLTNIAEDEVHRPQIVRTKQFSIKPMPPEEAALQMKLIGHDFFIFRNVETSKTNVIYLRKDGNFGLLEPES